MYNTLIPFDFINFIIFSVFLFLFINFMNSYFFIYYDYGILLFINQLIITYFIQYLSGTLFNLME